MSMILNLKPSPTPPMDVPTSILVVAACLTLYAILYLFRKKDKHLIKNVKVN